MILPRVGVSVGGDSPSSLTPPSLCSSSRPPGAPPLHSSRDSNPIQNDSSKRARPVALFSFASPNLHRPQRISAKGSRQRRFQISLKRQPSPPPEAVGLSGDNDSVEARSRVYSNQVRHRSPLRIPTAILFCCTEWPNCIGIKHSMGIEADCSSASLKLESSSWRGSGI